MRANQSVPDPTPGWPTPGWPKPGSSGPLLRARICFDALRLAPRTVLLAGWWRLLGKRMRARSMIAPLLGQSPRAYRFWLARDGGRPRVRATPAGRAVTIVALVATGDGQERTLESLAAEGIEWRPVPPGEMPGLHAIGRMNDGGGWFLPLAAGDVLASGAGSAYREAAAHAGAGARVVYSDDDLIDPRGRRADPHFKPDWNSELYRYFDYLSGAAILRPDQRDMDRLPAENWPAALNNRVVERLLDEGGAPIHLRHVLHHRRTRPAPRSASRAETSAALPTVTIIVPTRNRHDLLGACLEGVARTRYPEHMETIVIDNGSDDPATLDYLAGLDPAFARVLRHPGPFNFAAMNNRAAGEASGQLLCFLNNDIEIVDPDWLATMATQAVRDDVGAVGACLLYPDGRLQHAGVVVGIGGGAAHAHRLLRPEEDGYFRRHALPQFVSAVTAACLVVQRERFLAVGGFDAEKFAVAFNDVDLCLKLNARGWQSLYEPRAVLVHHESVSRGLDRDPAGAARLAGELAALKARWGTGGGDRGEAVDPFHHPSLSPFSERFVVRI